jgi:hypothetical protein
MNRRPRDRATARAAGDAAIYDKIQLLALGELTEILEIGVRHRFLTERIHSCSEYGSFARGPAGFAKKMVVIAQQHPGLEPPVRLVRERLLRVKI